MPICRVCIVGVESPISSGQKYWFQADRKTYTAAAARAGLCSGSRIRRRNRQCPHPSIVRRVTQFARELQERLAQQEHAERVRQERQHQRTSWRTTR